MVLSVSATCRVVLNEMSAPIHRLDVGSAFQALTNQERLYAYHMSCAAWHGARIVLRQVSPEANGIFNFIMELHCVCSGRWNDIARRCGVSDADISAFLDYAATFLSNIGNYYGSGDQKFVPQVPQATMATLAKCSAKAERLYKNIAEP